MKIHPLSFVQCRYRIANMQAWHMKNNSWKHEENCVYPGQYIPLVNEENIRIRWGSFLSEDIRLLPPLNFTESESAYQLEIAVPGMNREDFLLRADGDVLFISLLHQSDRSALTAYRIHEFNYDCFERRIDLPAEGDVCMIHAAYQNGMLRIHVPKSDSPIRMPFMRIVVY